MELFLFYFFTSRVLEIVPSVPTSKTDCSVCPAVLKACLERTTPWCGNTPMRGMCVSSATKTAPKGKQWRTEAWQSAFVFLFQPEFWNPKNQISFHTDSRQLRSYSVNKTNKQDIVFLKFNQNSMSQFQFLGHFGSYLLKYSVSVVCSPLWSETMTAQTELSVNQMFSVIYNPHRADDSPGKSLWQIPQTTVVSGFLCLCNSHEKEQDVFLWLLNSLIHTSQRFMEISGWPPWSICRLRLFSLVGNGRELASIFWEKEVLEHRFGFESVLRCVWSVFDSFPGVLDRVSEAATLNREYTEPFASSTKDKKGIKFESEINHVSSTESILMSNVYLKRKKLNKTPEFTFK